MFTPVLVAIAAKKLQLGINYFFGTKMKDGGMINVSGIETEYEQDRLD